VEVSLTLVMSVSIMLKKAGLVKNLHGGRHRKRSKLILEHNARFDTAVEKAALAEPMRRLEESRLREEAIRQSEFEERLAARRSLANADERAIDAVQHAHGQTLSFTLASTRQCAASTRTRCR